MKKLQLSYFFCESEEQAQRCCERINRNAGPYRRKKHPAHYTPWKSSSATDTAKYVVLYYC